MNRRGFLHAMLAAGAAPAIVKAANIMPVFARLDSGLLVPRFMDDLVRAAYAYDALADLAIVRFDIVLDEGYRLTKFGVDQRFPTMEAAKAFGAKDIACKLFDNEIRHAGCSWRDVKPLTALRLT